MKCLMVKNELKAYIDGELGPIARRRIARHLARCVECSMEVEAMTDLTNQVTNAGAVPAPDGLKDKVLGRLHFEPAGAAARWSYKTKPIVVVGVLVVVALMAATIMPTFNRARETARRAPQMADLPAPGEPKAGNATGGMGYGTNASPAMPRPPAAKRLLAEPEASEKSDAYTAYMMPKTPKSIAVHEEVKTGAVATRGSAADAFAPLMIIKTAEISVLVKSYSQASDEAVAAARSAGGYVTDSSTNSEAGVPTSGTMTIRVPASNFEKVVERLGKLGKVTSKTMGGQDVSAEYVDLESQLRNKRAEERQYLDIMNKAKHVQDIVTVSEELYRVRGEIEEMTGRMNYLKSSATMSTINLTLSEKEKPQPAPQGMIRQSFSDALASLVGTLGTLAGILIWLAVYSPFWALPVLGLLHWRRRAQAAAS